MSSRSTSPGLKHFLEIHFEKNMCGIAAIYAYLQPSPPIDRDELLRMRDAMEKRGPDGAGLWVSQQTNIGLAHRRLSIIDLSHAGDQPMSTPDGRLRIVFNGEIYNYRKLRDQLKAKGHLFRSDSDTEVLLHAWREYGQKMVHHLRGMFAFVIVDEDRRGLFLARDHFGIKPLYYHDDGKTFRAASQVKAMLAGGGIQMRPEPAGHVGFHLMGCVPEPYTLYRNLFALPAGHTLWVDSCGPRTPHRYFNITDELEEATATRIRQPFTETLKDALYDSVRHHLIADVPVGVFLSSGLDSSTLTAIATEVMAPASLKGEDLGRVPLQAITLGFLEYENTPADEVPLARMLAKRYGCAHHVGRITQEDFAANLSAILSAMDQPSIDGVNTWFVAREARRAGLKVVLSGLGGDELLGGYPSFRQIPKLVSRIRPLALIPGLGMALRFISAPLLRHFTSPKYAGLFEYGGSYGGAYLLRRGLFMPWELPRFMDGEFVREGWSTLQPVLRLDEWTSRVKSPHAKVMTMEMGCYMRNMLLRDSDWAGMAHSLEIRVPMVDISLFRALAPYLVNEIPHAKRDLADLPKRFLPDEITRRPKTGFSIPVRDWMTAHAKITGQRGLRGWAGYVIKSDQKQGHSCENEPQGEKFPAMPPNSEPATAKGKTVLALMSDAYGGRGGIAKFNRDLLWALCAAPTVQEIIAVPRLLQNTPEALPNKLRWITAGLGGKIRYARAILGVLRGSAKADVVLCGHVNLLPLAWLAARAKHASLWCVIHGTDAWQPSKSALVNRLLRKVDGVIAVSDTTRKRFSAWSGVPEENIHILPNCYDPALFYPASQNELLVNRYNLRDQDVLLTVGRLSSSERCKGFDEVIELLPELSRENSRIVYLVVGEGDDRPRLEEKARALGVTDKVIFAGYVEEAEKADHYRLADVFVMPSRGEGFGIVFLEALACGVPVIGSELDGSREALADGRLGLLVDPTKPDEIREAIRSALQAGRGNQPEGLMEFSLCGFKEKAWKILDRATQA
jgi:asparagine synthase (glutamine-hydrolysing)